MEDLSNTAQELEESSLKKMREIFGSCEEQHERLERFIDSFSPISVIGFSRNAR